MSDRVYDQQHYHHSSKEDRNFYEATFSTAASTPFVTAPSSPRNSLSAASNHELGDVRTSACSMRLPKCVPASTDFDFRVRIFGGDSHILSAYPASTIMSTPEELFHNGKIKPLDTSSFFSCCTCFKHAVNAGGYSCDPLPLANMHTLDIPSCPPLAACNDPRMLQQNAECVDVNPLPASREQGQTKNDPDSTTSISLESRGKAPVSRRNTDSDRTSRPVHVHPHAGRVIPQIPSFPLPSYNNNGVARGHHRRSRSLSPLRVFHMDDMIFQPRPSFESERLYTHMSSNSYAEDAVDGGTTKPRRRRSSRKSWTLKELLNLAVDNRVHDKRNSQIRGKVDLTSARERTDSKKDSGDFKGSSSDGKGSKQVLIEDGIGIVRPPRNHQGRQVAEHYLPKQNTVHTQEAKSNTMLPCKKGLFACLGFTSKLSSMKGVHGMTFDTR